MDEYLKQSKRKLVMWFTKTFKPIMTHDELEPIMATLGFVGLEPVINRDEISWKSYVYSGAHSLIKSMSTTERPPIPRLPYPRIDGLHIYTYRAFLDAINFYLQKYNISDVFHIRGLPLSQNQDQNQDQNRNWCRMYKENIHYAYIEGTLDRTTIDLYESQESNNDDNSDDTKEEKIDHHKEVIKNDIFEDIVNVVDLKDIITQQDYQ